MNLEGNALSAAPALAGTRVIAAALVLLALLLAGSSGVLQPAVTL